MRQCDVYNVPLKWNTTKEAYRIKDNTIKILIEGLSAKKVKPKRRNAPEEEICIFKVCDSNVIPLEIEANTTREIQDTLGDVNTPRLLVRKRTLPTERPPLVGGEVNTEKKKVH
jgi:hypothetical protein